MKKKIFSIIVLGLCLSGCSAKMSEKSWIPGSDEIKSTSVLEEKKIITPTHENLPTKSPELVEEVVPTIPPMEELIDDKKEDVEYDQMLTQMADTEIDVLTEKVFSGEITGFVSGDTKFLVWKNVALGINSVDRYKYAILNYLGEYESEFFTYDASEEPNEIKHMGSNIFYISSFNNVIMCHDTEKGKVFTYSDRCGIIAPFSDGYALARTGEGFVQKEGSKTLLMYDLVTISDEGVVEKTPLYWYSGFNGKLHIESQVGRYSNGVFYLDNAFYDIKGKKKLDLNEIEVLNIPVFEGKYCWIEYKNAGVVWGAYMDIDGAFFDEPQKLYDAN